MNINEIKRVFYQRYDTSKDFLHYTFTGSLCPLLGYREYINAPFLSCSLSMGIGMFARRQGSNIITLQNTVSDRHFIYEKTMPYTIFKGGERDIAKLLKIMSVYCDGAQILFKSDIPSFMPQKTEFRTALTHSLLKVSGVDFPSYEKAYLAAMKEPIAPYLALSYAKSGYGILFDSYIPYALPLPMKGYKVIIVYTRRDDTSREDRIYSAMEKIQKHFGSNVTLSSLNLSHAYYVQQHFRDRKTIGYIHHLAGENSRMQSVARGLKKSDISSLFRAMNASQTSIARYWDVRKDHSYICLTARRTDGVRAARQSQKGAVIIAETGKVDYVINTLRREFEYNMGYKPVICVCDAL